VRIGVPKQPNLFHMSERTVRLARNPSPRRSPISGTARSTCRCRLTDGEHPRVGLVGDARNPGCPDNRRPRSLMADSFPSTPPQPPPLRDCPLLRSSTPAARRVKKPRTISSSGTGRSSIRGFRPPDCRCCLAGVASHDGWIIDAPSRISTAHLLPEQLRS